MEELVKFVAENLRKADVKDAKGAELAASEVVSEVTSEVSSEVAGEVALEAANPTARR